MLFLLSSVLWLHFYATKNFCKISNYITEKMKALTYYFLSHDVFFHVHWRNHTHGNIRTARVIYNRIDIELAKCVCVLSYKQYIERHQQYTPILPLSKECEMECVAWIPKSTHFFKHSTLIQHAVAHLLLYTLIRFHRLSWWIEISFEFNKHTHTHTSLLFSDYLTHFYYNRYDEIVLAVSFYTIEIRLKQQLQVDRLHVDK